MCVCVGGVCVCVSVTLHGSSWVPQGSAGFFGLRGKYTQTQSSVSFLSDIVCWGVYVCVCVCSEILPLGVCQLSSSIVEHKIILDGVFSPFLVLRDGGRCRYGAGKPTGNDVIPDAGLRGSDIMVAGSVGSSSLVLSFLCPPPLFLCERTCTFCSYMWAWPTGWRPLDLLLLKLLLLSQQLSYYSLKHIWIHSLE